MPQSFENDLSCGYDEIAEQFINIRSNSGTALVKKWAAALPEKSSIIDIGAGSGQPLTQVLINTRLNVYALDASHRMIEAFQSHFPNIPIACEAAQTSAFFERKFDAVLMVGLIFLLPEDAQILLLTHISKALHPKGRLLFSAPHQIHTWNDNLTGRKSTSLGRAAYILWRRQDFIL